MANQSSGISTSALAKKLGKSTKQMFSELEALGWIRREGEQWQLTGKGEFEKGRYRESEKYGRYIVWPESIPEHRSLSKPEDKYTTAKGLALKTDLSPGLINQLLAELGWIKPWRKGWQLTRNGKTYGGIQKEDSKTAIPYVAWPKNLTGENVFKASLSRFKGHVSPVVQYSGCAAIDGHLLRSEAELRIDNWLYLAGITHACHRQLPVDEPATADFYLPELQLFIEYWGSDSDPSYLAKKMLRKTLYQQHNLEVLELTEQDLEQLDEVLRRELRRYGLDC